MFQFQGQEGQCQVQRQEDQFQVQRQKNQLQVQRQSQLPQSSWPRDHGFLFKGPQLPIINPKIKDQDFDLKIPNLMIPETYALSKQQGVITTHLDIIEELWSKKQLCDVTLIVEEQKFEAHKIILASHIPYFREMFSNDKYQESHEAEIKLSDLDPKIMIFILEYVYGRKLEITRDDLIKILHHADYFMMKDLKDWCEKTLMNTVTTETCIENFLLSRRYKLPALNEKIKSYCREHSDLSSHEDSYELSKEEFSELWLEILDAESAYLALMEWIKHDLDNRKGLLHELLKIIPQDGISSSFFKSEMADEELLKENHQCSLWLLEVATAIVGD